MVELKEIIVATIFIFGSESLLLWALVKPSSSIALLRWVAWDFSGLRLIWSKVLPPKYNDESKQRPSSFLLWFIGTYVALFGVASQRYENRIDLIENRANSIFSQLSTPAFKSALGRISTVQNMDCPVKPEVLEPRSVYLSLFGEDQKYPEMVALLRLTVENWKESLRGVDLSGADLDGADLSGADLEGAELEGANLRGACLVKANLKKAVLDRADLSNGYTWGADLESARPPSPPSLP